MESAGEVPCLSLKNGYGKAQACGGVLSPGDLTIPGTGSQDPKPQTLRLAPRCRLRLPLQGLFEKILESIHLTQGDFILSLGSLGLLAVMKKARRIVFLESGDPIPQALSQLQRRLLERIPWSCSLGSRSARKEPLKRLGKGLFIRLTRVRFQRARRGQKRSLSSPDEFSP